MLLGHQVYPEKHDDNNKIELRFGVKLTAESSHRQLIEAQNAIDVNKRYFSVKKNQNTECFNYWWLLA